ncbi:MULTISPECIES: chemotaxis protein CheW [unclassified Beijerinckia]|uniref:hybrid sensor histidine kinase/response regulator n=1 Tax=unclassified Beijerinckia TaxID=2638183 RepID=UPI00089A42AF|nr:MULTISPECIES: chemotaxis protein CheW [unclassified Beijerinckia]MDH7799560.1 two-component system chemotaxis sensor kinase CheA [Beijerinckia sp. GAS462]SEB46676.1 two-component system, chemotaxis family, sensor kinase CheA [Beijerinckia sp. 28-YEA-48]
MDELLSEFIVEANEQIEAAASQLVAFEREPTNFDSITSIYRLIHTIKGTCGFLDLTRLARLTHAAETLISRIRDERVATPAAVSLILSTVDRIQSILDGLEKTGKEPVEDDSDLIATLEGLAAADLPAPTDDLLANDLLANDLLAMPAKAEEPVAEKPPVAATPAASHTPSNRENASIRIAVGAVERLMRLVSELVLTRNQLAEITRHASAGELALPMQRLSAITTDLQDGVMQVRMQPIDRLFSSLPRLVRDLGHELGKKIDLIVEGSDTDFDRQLVELLRTPLVHIIRNCADHGIEPAAERLAIGKPATGRIRVSASHEASHITIEVADDGRGLDSEKIRAKAQALGLASAADLAGLSKDELTDFIFAPGFSTASHVTQVSGRGLGMDIVRQTVESIGGRISLSSQPGVGCVFKLNLPLTLAIAPALIVTSHVHRFAVPQHAVLEAVACQPGGVNYLDMTQNALVLHLRDKVLPVIDLARHFNPSAPPTPIDREQLVIVLRSGTATFAATVDTITDIQEIVVKPLGASLADISGFAGNTILGDGSVILILDIASLAATLGLTTSTSFRPEEKDDGEYHKEPMRMIVFRAGPGPRKAVPLSQISRIENVATSDIERSGGTYILKRGTTIIPLAACWEADFSTQPQWPVLIIGVAGEPMGLAVSEIIDIIDEPMNIDIPSSVPTLLGSTTLAGQTTEIIDLAHYMQIALPDAFRRGHARKFSVLLVDDKQFFRDLLAPVISAAGYDVTAVGTGTEAIRLVERGIDFDAVITDIDMPDMNGYKLAQTLRANEIFGTRPIIAIDAYAGPTIAAAAKNAGMTDVVGKFDRAGLIGRLSTALEAETFGNSSIERSAFKGAAA